jgi:hypothetical protein
VHARQLWRQYFIEIIFPNVIVICGIVEINDFLHKYSIQSRREKKKAHIFRKLINYKNKKKYVKKKTIKKVHHLNFIVALKFSRWNIFINY